MGDLDLKDIIYLLGIVVGIAASHYSLRGRVMVLEERTRRFDDCLDEIKGVLQRIEQKMDQKADK